MGNANARRDWSEVKEAEEAEAGEEFDLWTNPYMVEVASQSKKRMTRMNSLGKGREMSGMVQTGRNVGSKADVVGEQGKKAL